MASSLTTFGAVRPPVALSAFDGPAATPKTDDPDRLADTWLRISTSRRPRNRRWRRRSRRNVSRRLPTCSGEIEKINPIAASTTRSRSRWRRRSAAIPEREDWRDPSGARAQRRRRRDATQEEDRRAEMPKDAEKATAEQASRRCPARQPRRSVPQIHRLAARGSLEEIREGAKDIGLAEKILNDDHYGNEKNQREIRISPCGSSLQEGARPTTLRRPARGGQDLARPIDCKCRTACSCGCR